MRKINIFSTNYHVRISIDKIIYCFQGVLSLVSVAYPPANLAPSLLTSRDARERGR